MPADVPAGPRLGQGLVRKAGASHRVECEDVILLDVECDQLSRGRRLAPFGPGHDRVPALSQAHMQQGVGAKLFY